MIQDLYTVVFLRLNQQFSWGTVFECNYKTKEDGMVFECNYKTKEDYAGLTGRKVPFYKPCRHTIALATGASSQCNWDELMLSVS